MEYKKLGGGGVYLHHVSVSAGSTKLCFTLTTNSDKSLNLYDFPIGRLLSTVGYYFDGSYYMVAFHIMRSAAEEFNFFMGDNSRTEITKRNVNITDSVIKIN